MSIPSEIRNAAGAVLAEMVHDAGGIDAVRTFLRTPGRGVRRALSDLLARQWADVVVAWRQRVTVIAGR